jgi:hypothetical protein
MRKEIYNEIQEILEFADFITTIKEFNPADITKIEKFKNNIRNIDNMDGHVLENSFGLSLDLFDWNYTKDKITNESVYWRRWRVNMECGRLEIECLSRICEEVLERCSTHSYIELMFPIPLEDEEDIYRNGKIAEFIADVRLYETHITEYLNEVEIEYWD